MLTALAFALFVVVAVLIAMRVIRNPAVPEPPGFTLPTPVQAASFGMRAFSAIAALAIVLATLFLLEAVANPWIIGLIAGAVLVGVSELIVRKFTMPANALSGAGLATLYASLYALVMNGIAPFAIVAAGLAVLTVATIWLALRRDSVFVGVIAIAGGLLAPVLLGLDEEGRALFSYLLALNVAAAWLTIKRGWAVLIAVCIPATVLYEWGWVIGHLTSSRLPMAAAMFALLAISGASPLWVEPRGDHPLLFRRAAAAAALLPLLFAFYMATVPNYARQYNVLFAFLLVVAAGLAAVVWRGAPRYLHIAGGVAVLFTFFLWLVHWLTQSYTYSQWPVPRAPGLVLSICIWLALFVIVYLLDGRAVAGLLFFVFLGLAIRQPQDAVTLIVAMLLLLWVVVLALRSSRPVTAAIAIAFASLTLIAFTPLPIFWPLFPAHALQDAPGWFLLLIAHALVFAALFVVARSSGRHVLTILAVPFYAVMIATTARPDTSAIAQLAIALVPYAMFILYAAATRDSFAPFVAAALASLVLLFGAYAALDGTPVAAYIGVIPMLEAIVVGALLWRTFALEPREPRLTLLTATTLAFLSAAVALLLPDIWTVMVWSILVAALMYLYTRLPHPALVVWAVGLATVIFLRLAFEADLGRSRTTFIVAGVMMFAAAYFSPATLRLVFSLFGLTELLFRINIELANHYRTTGGALNLDLLHERPDAAYTVVWAVVATSLLFIGVFFHWRGARIGAVGLLSLAILKCFLHDWRYLHNDERVAAFFVIGIALVVAGALLQRFMSGATRLQT
jgi:hypothetical protein